MGAAVMATPPLPPGFQLDQPASAPPLPPGFTLDTPPIAQENNFSPNLEAASMADPNIGKAEAAATMVTGMMAAPIAGLAGMAQGVKNWFSPGTPAADRVHQVQQALTYEPRTTGGKQYAQIAAQPFEWLAQGADKAGGVVVDATDSPAAGTAVSTGIQMLPAVLFRGRGAKPTSAPNAAGAAENYVRTRTGLDWTSLPDEARARLTRIAEDQKTLDALDPKALERQLQLESLPVPIKNASKGQLTRDPRQLQQEELLKSTDAGNILAQDAIAQNRAITQNIEFLRDKTGGKPLSDIDLGRSIQDQNLRAKQSTVKANVSALYDEARTAGEMASPVKTKPITEWLKDPGNKRNAPDIASALEDYSKRGKITINDLEKVRQEATMKSNSPDGATRHYYGEAVRVIDKILDESGGVAYRKARAAHRAERTEFGDQAAVERLVTDKTRTDRQTALEDTHNKVVVQGSLEQLSQVRESLLKGGTAETRSRGAQAWKDLGATTIENIKAEATKGATNAAGEGNSTYTRLKSAIERVGDDKLKLLIGEESTAQLRNVLKSAETLKTEPTGINVRGSNTVNKLMNILDKTLVTKIPGLGTTVEGVVRGAAKIQEIGKTGREVKAAQQTPMSFAEVEAKKAVNKKKGGEAFKNLAVNLRTVQDNDAP